VSARDLHRGLQVGKDFSTWIKGRIDRYGFVEGIDFVTELDSPNLGIQVGHGGRRQGIEYHVTLDVAKELCMIENNDHGRFAAEPATIC
jgi:anti-repressor protein